jgi:hypothetical protein
LANVGGNKFLTRYVVTKDQEKNGWTDYERRRLMQWFYQHKQAVKPKVEDLIDRDFPYPRKENKGRPVTHCH